MCTQKLPKGNMRYAQSTVPDTVAVETNFFYCFPLALTDICPWPLLSFFQISLKTVKSKPPTHEDPQDLEIGEVGHLK